MDAEILKKHGLTATSYLNSTMKQSWHISGSTFPWKEVMKQYSGYYSGAGNVWEMPDHRFKEFVKHLKAAAATGKRKEIDRPSSDAKRTKVENIRELKERVAAWNARLDSDEGEAIQFIITYIWTLGVQLRGPQMWSPLESANECDHACGLNVLWELFLSAERDIEKAVFLCNGVCPGCGDSYV